MSPQRNNLPDPDDMFEDSRMTFPEHIEDLRTHLLRALYGFLVCFILGFFIAPAVLRFISAPVEKVLGEYYDELFIEKYKEISSQYQGKTLNVKMQMKVSRKGIRSIVAGDEDLKQDKIARAFEKAFIALGFEELLEPDMADEDLVTLPVWLPDPLGFALQVEKLRLIIRPPTLTTLAAQEAFVVYIKIAILTGLVLSSPWVFWQIWAFVAAGLYQHEKKLVHVYLPLSLFLFLGGVIVCQFFVIPKAVEALLWFNKLLGLQPDLRLSEWLGFAILMPLIFGISFQTPLVMLFLERIGIFDVEVYRSKRRIAIFLIAIFSAVITPTVDVFSMMLLFLPMVLLYELGIWMCALSPRPKFLESELEDSEDLIEV